MKRFLAIPLCLLMLFYGTALMGFQPPEWVVPSSMLTASGSVASPAGYLYKVMIVTDGTNDVTLNLYDSYLKYRTQAVVGTTLIASPITINAAATFQQVQTISWYPPLAYSSGVFASPSSAGTFKLMFYYRER